MVDPHDIANEARRMIQLNQHEAALRLLVRAKQQFPHVTAIHYRLGVVLMEMGKHKDALGIAEQAVKLDANDFDLHYLYGRALLANHKDPEAVAAFVRCTEIDAKSSAAWVSLGQAQHMLGLSDESLVSCEQAVRVEPDNKTAIVNLNRRRLDLGLCEEAHEGLVEAYQKGLRDENFMSLLLLGMHYPDGPTPQEIFDWHLKFGDLMRSIVRPYEPVFTHDRSPDRKLRIGWLTHDFYAHSVTFFHRALLEHLDKSQFENTVYHYPLKVDATTEELKKKIDRYRLLERVHVQDLAQMIDNDRIDILIDLMGHTRLGSFTIFPLQPAPIGVTMIGYPDTTGVPGVHFRIVDAITDPDGADAFASETLVRMPNCFVCFTPPASAPEPVRERSGPMTYGSFNALFKLNRSVIRSWAEILAGVPDSRMIIKAKGLEVESVRQRIWGVFAEAGVDSSRVDLRGFEKESKSHWTMYNEIDLVLDSFPYNGTTTTCEALMMSVPVLAILGGHHAARVSASILGACGHPEWIASDREEYVRRAIEMGRDPSLIRLARATLSTEFRESPVCDGPRYAADFAQELRKMWKTFCLSS